MTFWNFISKTISKTDIIWTIGSYKYPLIQYSGILCYKWSIYKNIRGRTELPIISVECVLDLNLVSVNSKRIVLKIVMTKNGLDASSSL